MTGSVTNLSETITITIKDGQAVQKILHDKERSILETFTRNGMAQGSFCKGLSLCGRCRIRFLKGAPLPGTEERKLFDPAELREGYRLACRAKPKQDCTIELCFENEPDMQIVAETGNHVERKALSITDLKSARADQGNIIGSAAENPSHPRVFAAVDIGTTTVVMQLADVLTGEVLATEKFLNPQRRYGLDVLSRIQAAIEYGEEMRDCILQAVLQGIKKLGTGSRNRKEAVQLGTEVFQKPELLCITGNTAMLHIFMGADTSGLGKSPFTPVFVHETEIEMEGIKVLLMPSVSAFIGADVSAGILETKMQQSEQINLLIDLGTNGEMALGNRKKILSCAAAAGPAFEGGAAGGIYGADMLAAIAGLLDAGVIEESGYMEKPESCLYQGKQIEITLEKVRQIQLAKAAVRAGIELLIKKYGLASCEQIDSVYLAGGFGFFLSDYAAVRTGLLPEKLKGKISAVGNSALAGALRYGREFLLHRGADALDTSKIESFNLAEEKEFQETYIRYMDFPAGSRER